MAALVVEQCSSSSHLQVNILVAYMYIALDPYSTVVVLCMHISTPHARPTDLNMSLS